MPWKGENGATRLAETLTILLGTLAATMFGIGDLIAGVGGRKDRSPDTPAGIAFVASTVGAVLSGSYLVVISDDRFAGNDIWWAIAAGILMSAARPLLYRGMAVGPIVVFAPVFAVFALIIPALLGAAVGQSLVALEIVAVLVAIPAVVLLSSEARLPKLSELRSSSILGSAAAVGALTGLAGLCLSFVSDDAGAAPAFALTLLGIVVIPISSRTIGLTVRLKPTTLKFGSLVGCTSVVAFILAAITFQRGNAAIGSALIGLSPGVSIALAWKLLGERVWPIQLLGGALGATTVILFAMAV